MSESAKPFQSVCVFCGSKTGDRSEYRDAADAMGKLLAKRRLRLVYGGGSVGLMGVVADAVLAGGGAITGVLPRMLATKELRHRGVEDMRIVESMHDRKALMAELADAFVALPGGFGTMEEMFEVVSWAQLGLHAKPIGLLDVTGFYAPLAQWIDLAIADGFIKPKYRELIVIEPTAEALLDCLAAHQMPAVRQWIDKAEI